MNGKLDIIKREKSKQVDCTDQDKDYAIFYGKTSDLLIALPHLEKLTRNYKIYFSKKVSKYHIMTIYSGKKVYKVLFNDNRVLFKENGYYCIMGRYPHQKGLHKIPLHRLAYRAFYGTPPPYYHIHHINHDKKDNSMNNLVALTEQDHERVHGHSVSVGTNMFTTPKKPTLLTLLEEEAKLEKTTPPKEEEQLLVQLEKAITPSLITLLNNKATRSNLSKISQYIEEGKETVLEFLYNLYLATLTIEPIKEE